MLVYLLTAARTDAFPRDRQRRKGMAWETKRNEWSEEEREDKKTWHPHALIIYHQTGYLNMGSFQWRTRSFLLIYFVVFSEHEKISSLSPWILNLCSTLQLDITHLDPGPIHRANDKLLRHSIGDIGVNKDKNGLGMLITEALKIKKSFLESYLPENRLKINSIHSFIGRLFRLLHEHLKMITAEQNSTLALSYRVPHRSFEPVSSYFKRHLPTEQGSSWEAADVAYNWGVHKTPSLRSGQLKPRSPQSSWRADLHRSVLIAPDRSGAGCSVGRWIARGSHVCPKARHLPGNQHSCKLAPDEVGREGISMQGWEGSSSSAHNRQEVCVGPPETAAG